MKKILITGKNSYIGKEFNEWIKNNYKDYSVDSISLRGDIWLNKNFSEYDVILHTVGLAHQRETKKNANFYFEINRDLAYEVARKAKQEGVKQFIFLSSMSVYGIENGVIDNDTPLKPTSNYGKSKLEAERLITMLEDSKFKIAIVRPPLVYGRGCKGNYKKLSILAKNIPFFIDVKNERSMIYIDNLSKFIKQIIDNNNDGVFCPQNIDYVNTSNMVKLISKANNKEIKFIKIPVPLLKILMNFKTLNKIFGSLVYDKKKAGSINNFVDFEESILITEGKYEKSYNII